MNASGSEPVAPPTASGQAGVASSGQVAVPTWWGNISQQFQHRYSTAQQHAQQIGRQIQAASKEWKPPDLSKGLGMKLDIDFLNPAITGLKQQWQQLPEPVKEVMPYAGVALAASMSVRHLYQEQLSIAHQRYGQLKEDHTTLQQQFNQLEAQLDEINTKRTGAHLEIQMAEAVAKAASAAASAATAAASAAAACSAGEGHKRR